LATFTTRVELHRADDEDYETLHTAIEQRGFSRSITGADGVAYHLPTAEYSYIGSMTRNEVLTLAKEAAGETNRKHGVLVTESNGRAWQGLTQT
jgi:hypothetical protein